MGRGRAFETKSFLPWRLKIFSPRCSKPLHISRTNGKGERFSCSISLRIRFNSGPGKSRPETFPGIQARSTSLKISFMRFAVTWRSNASIESITIRSSTGSLSDGSLASRAASGSASSSATGSELASPSSLFVSESSSSELTSSLITGCGSTDSAVSSDSTGAADVSGATSSALADSFCDSPSGRGASSASTPSGFLG